MKYNKIFNHTFNTQRDFHKENAFSRFDSFRSNISNGKIRSATVVNFLSSIDAFLDCHFKALVKRRLEQYSNSEIILTHNELLDWIESNLHSNLPSHLTVQIPSGSKLHSSYNSPKGVVQSYTSHGNVEFDFGDFKVVGQLQYMLFDNDTLNSACFHMYGCFSKNRVGSFELNRIGRSLKLAVESWH